MLLTYFHGSPLDFHDLTLDLTLPDMCIFHYLLLLYIIVIIKEKFYNMFTKCIKRVSKKYDVLQYADST